MSEARKISPLGHSIETDFGLLSDEAKSRVKGIEESFELMDPETVLSFGFAEEEVGKSFFSTMAKHLISRDLGHLGELLWDLSQHLTTAARFDEVLPPSFLGRVVGTVLGYQRKQVKQRQIVEANISLSMERIRNYQLALVQDSNLLEEYFQEYSGALDELNLWVIAGERKLLSLRSALKKEQETYSDESSALSARGMGDFGLLLDSFGDRIKTLSALRSAMVDFLPLIRPVQEGNLELAQRIQSSVVDAFQTGKRPVLSPRGKQKSEGDDVIALPTPLSEGLEGTLEFQHLIRQKRVEVCERFQSMESELAPPMVNLRILN